MHTGLERQARCLKAHFLLTRAFQNKAPFELVSRIVNSAEYWLKSTNKNSYSMLVEQADRGRPYMISKPIVSPSKHPVRKITVKVDREGHEGVYPALFPQGRS